MEMIVNDMNNTESEELVEKATLTDQVTVVGVKFNNNSKIYYFDPVKIKAKLGDCVIVETARGLEYGFVAEGIRKAYYQDNKEDAIIMWRR